MEMENDLTEGIVVHTQQMDLTLSQLREMSDANDIITNPDYQRKYVYDDPRASKLVESILIGIPIPVIYLCEEKENEFSVIDGQQRITSFVRFLKNEFALVGLNKLPKMNNLYFRDLNKTLQRRLNSKSLKVICLSKDSQDLKYEIFSRLNLGAVKLKDQELRNCIYRGSFNDMLKEIAEKNKTLRTLFHDNNKRSAYEERILRFFALRNFPNIKGTFKLTMNEYMDKHKSDSPDMIEKAKNQYCFLIDIIKQVLGDDAFFSKSGKELKKFNGAVYDSIIIPFSYFSKKALLKHADTIRKEINHLKLHDKEYQNNVYVGTNSGARVNGRILRVMKILNSIIESDSNEFTPRVFNRETKEMLYYDGCTCSYCGNEILSIEDCEIASRQVV
ncbi:hypothetical protein GCM10027018_08320 [Paenibacillus thermoaerophilus]